MKQITKYKALDGVEFLSKSQCIEHENNCHDFDIVMEILKPPINSNEFSNGGGYIQHDMDSFKKARMAFLELVKRYTSHKWIQQSIDGTDIDPSWAARIIGDCCPAHVNKLWYRFMCTDKMGREFGQPYYVNHPEDADLIELS